MNQNKISIKIAGPAGYGIKTTGSILSKLCLRCGLNVFDTIEYPSLIRGGHNVFYVRAGEGKVLSIKEGIDFLLALNVESIRLHRDEIQKDGGILFDQDSIDKSKIEVRSDIKLYSVPINSIARKLTGSDIARNTVALGALTYIIGLSKGDLDRTIKGAFSGKPPEVIETNIMAADAGYEYAKENFLGDFKHKIHPVKGKKQTKEKILISGNEAIAFGAISAGCSFYSAYPMTPSSSILHTLAKHAKETKMVVKHAEDEISVVNMAIGASFAGARSMCATSGGGLALMNEAIGLAGITETPLVVVDVQRPGPATGLPTWHGQGDLQFVLHTAQGEFPRVLIAPGDPEECYYLTAEAFNLAEIYQTPVLMLSDKYLGESDFTIKIPDHKKIEINRGKLINQKELDKIETYKRYEFAKDGISKRTIPGMKGGIFLANSDEHDEFGYTSEDANNATKQMEKRMQKEKEILRRIPQPVVRGPKEADVTIVSWGSTKGAIVEAIRSLKSEGIRARFMQIQYIWPFKSNYVKKILEDSKNTLLVEGNYNGQLGQLIRQETGVEIQNKLLRYDGRPITPCQVVNKVKNIVR